jgi:hypothetical protein
MELNIQKINIVAFEFKTNSIHFNYCVSDILILRSNSIKDCGAMLESKLYFHSHVDFIFSQALRTFGLTCYITYNSLL